jgi:hypothetical protein
MVELIDIKFQRTPSHIYKTLRLSVSLFVYLFVTLIHIARLGASVNRGISQCLSSHYTKHKVALVNSPVVAPRG